MTISTQSKQEKIYITRIKSYNLGIFYFYREIFSVRGGHVPDCFQNPPSLAKTTLNFDNFWFQDGVAICESRGRFRAAQLYTIHTNDEHTLKYHDNRHVECDCNQCK